MWKRNIHLENWKKNQNYLFKTQQQQNQETHANNRQTFDLKQYQTEGFMVQQKKGGKI